jgi:hypothetical protein
VGGGYIFANKYLNHYYRHHGSTNRFSSSLRSVFNMYSSLDSKAAQPISPAAAAAAAVGCDTPTRKSKKKQQQKQQQQAGTVLANEALEVKRMAAVAAAEAKSMLKKAMAKQQAAERAEKDEKLSRGSRVDRRDREGGRERSRGKGDEGYGGAVIGGGKSKLEGSKRLELALRKAAGLKQRAEKMSAKLATEDDTLVK